MNLAIDIGNTSTKAALYNDKVMISKVRLRSPDSLLISSFIGRRSVSKAIVSSVSQDPSGLTDFLGNNIAKVHLLTWRSHYPFNIDYETPETLGVDRLAAAAGASFHYPGSDLLVIDAGSALTVDLIADGTFCGGSISPGLAMRFRALHEFTGRLPLAEARKEASFPGKSTNDAITGGVVMGLVFEINEYIRKFEKKYRRPITVITGGDSELINSYTDMKMSFHPDLVTDGLNYLLDYNA